MPKHKRINKKVLFKKTVEILQPLMGLSDWKMIVSFTRSEKMKWIADCEASPEYKTAKIRVSLNNIKNLTLSEIVATAIHEMSHCIEWELVEFTETLCKKDPIKLELTRKYEEQIATSLERILLPLFTEKLNQALKEQGYCTVDLTFTDFEVRHEPLH